MAMCSFAELGVRYFIFFNHPQKIQLEYYPSIITTSSVTRLNRHSYDG